MKYAIKRQCENNNEESIYAVYLTYKIKETLFSNWLSDFSTEKDAKEYIEKSKNSKKHEIEIKEIISIIKNKKNNSVLNKSNEATTMNESLNNHHQNPEYAEPTEEDLKHINQQLPEFNWKNQIKKLKEK